VYVRQQGRLSGTKQSAPPNGFHFYRVLTAQEEQARVLPKRLNNLPKAFTSFNGFQNFLTRIDSYKILCSTSDEELKLLSEEKCVKRLEQNQL
jgi:hypothetical protein